MSDSFTCPDDQIVRNGQVKSVSCLKTGMSGQCHYIILAQPLAEPVCDGCLTDIVECTLVYVGLQQYLIELS
jgi:hypothetical protein